MTHGHAEHTDDHADHHDHGQHAGGDGGHAEHGGHDEHGGHGGGGHHAHHERMVQDFKRRFFVSLIATVPILALSPLLQSLVGLEKALAFPGDLYVLFALSSFVFVYGGWPFLKGFVDEARGREPGMMTLIALAITVAYAYSAVVVFGLEGKIFFWELATLIDIMLLGHWVEMRSVMGASRALEELSKLMPTEAHKLDDEGNVTDVSVDELAPGDRLLVKPGERVPADGTVVEGETSINEAMLTGETNPVHKTEGAEVIGGGINGEGSITVEVGRTGEDSFLSQVMDLVGQAQASKSKTQNLAQRAALWLTIVALTAGAVTLAIWFGIVGRDFAFSIERTVTVMVITCPHALGLAIPLVVAVSTALGAGKGLLIRNRTAFEAARNLDAVVFDKTGTLTEGRFGVDEIVTLGDGHEEDEIKKLAAGVESRSEHPIAQAIAEAVDKPPKVSDFRSIPGKGAEGTVDGKRVRVVSPDYLAENDRNVANERIDALHEEGKTVVFVLVDDDLAGAIALSDIIREDSKQAIAELKEMGIQAMMLTGDNRKVAAWVAREIGLDDYFAEVLPDQKADKVKEVQGRGLKVAMTGDGVNDAPALAQADVGIAIGAGTDVAVETADIVLVHSNPKDVVSIVKLARATYRKMRQNLAWATGYNVFAIPLAAGVLYTFGILLSPALGAVLMSLSTVIVAVNARMLRID